jgi:hypothetical protein
MAERATISRLFSPANQPDHIGCFLCSCFLEKDFIFKPIFPLTRKTLWIPSLVQVVNGKIGN